MTSHEHCAGILDNLSFYLDGEASETLCAEIDRHLAGCQNCRVVVDTLRRTVLLYQTLPQLELPDRLRERLYRTLDLMQFLPQNTNK